jgi:hypothetical protein
MVKGPFGTAEQSTACVILPAPADARVLNFGAASRVAFSADVIGTKRRLSRPSTGLA